MSTSTHVSDTESCCCPSLVDGLDEAVRGARDTDDMVQRVEAALSSRINQGSVALPDDLRRPADGCYARRLIHRSPELGYTVLGMVWDQGQGTPLHDHCGMWCVEAVLEGRMSVTQYELMEEHDGLSRFEQRGSIDAGVGSAGSLIPPYEYHVMTNAEPRPSITIHVYGGEMVECRTFEEQEPGWYREQRRQLGYTQ